LREAQAFFIPIFFGNLWNKESVLLPVEDVDGIAELVALILFDLATADELAEIGVWIGGGVESSG